jgi:sulfopropanediol 3-dehydrogenase
VPPFRVIKPATGAGRAWDSDPGVRDTVRGIIDDVRARGDAAVREYSERFDRWSPGSFRLSAAEIEGITSRFPAQALEDIDFAQQQVRNFAQRQRESLRDFEVETLPGVLLGQRNIPVAAAGTYIPGGRFPLTASAHMTIVTAKMAGVGRVAACTPPIRGEIPAATVAAMARAGADEIYLLGGVQAVAAMAVGTETIEAVDMIAGPGNAYVAEAKRQLYGEVGIDLFAGPTEILVIADESADPFTVAVDLLSQAEHGPDSPAILVTTSDAMATEVAALIERLLPGMPTADLAGPAWRDYGQIIVAGSLDDAFAVANSIASEHVEVLTEQPRRALDKMTNYGALFLGAGTCVSYGDKVMAPTTCCRPGAPPGTAGACGSASTSRP